MEKVYSTELTYVVILGFNLAMNLVSGMFSNEKGSTNFLQVVWLN